MVLQNQQLPVAVLGAGIAGLAAAEYLQGRGIPVGLYEAGKRVAGLAASFHEDGFTYDFGAHFITNRLAQAVGVLPDCREVHYYGESVLLEGNRYYGYPFGLLLSPRYLWSGVQSRMLPSPSREESAADRFEAMYGKVLAREIAIPLTEAWSGVPAEDLAPAVADKIPVSIPKVLLLRVASLLRHRAYAIGYVREKPEGFGVWHVYPNRGLETLCDRLALPLQSSIHLETPVEAILVERDGDGERVSGIRVDGRDLPVAAVVSTVPCNVLPRLIRGSNALDYLQRFRFRPMVFIMMRFRGRNLLRDIVVWTPGTALPFFRLTETPQSMPWLAPAGKTLITADIGCQTGDAIWTMGDDALGEMCLEGLAQIVPGARDRYLGCRVLRTPVAYPVFHRDYEEDRKRFQQGSGITGLLSVGRNGEFEHLLSEDVYWRTRRKVEALVAGVAATMDDRHAVASAGA